MNRTILVYIGFSISLLMFNACDLSRSQGDRPQQSQTNSRESSLSVCYDRINSLCYKMQEEGKSFYPKMDLKVRHKKGYVTSVGQIYPTAAVALTEALNHGDIIIKNHLAAIKRGENVTANLQQIDGECYHIEKYCSDGINELGYSEQYLTSSMKDSWISVLKRIQNYSLQIREQVQNIREFQ